MGHKLAGQKRRRAEPLAKDMKPLYVIDKLMGFETKRYEYLHQVCNRKLIKLWVLKTKPYPQQV